MVAIIDAWTSVPRDGLDPRHVFNVGEVLQFNCVFLTELSTDSRIEITFNIDRMENAGIYTSDESAFDVVVRSHVKLQATFVVNNRAQHASARFEIPEVSETYFHGRGHTRRSLVLDLQGEDITLIFAEGFYQFRAAVQLLDVATGLPFDMSEPATYRIAASIG